MTMQAGDPTVSIVMPCYQQAQFVEEAVRSVLGGQDQEVDVELLVFDPGSTDGSRELLRQLADELGDRLVLHFAEDQGQSEAVNRGMALARGEILGWLNSDDRLQPGALGQVVARLLTAPEPAWLYGQAAMIDEHGQKTTGWITRYKSWRSQRFSRFKLLTENFIPQMAVFWNRAMWQRAGLLDPSKHLDMDYDLWLRFARIAPPVVVRDELAAFRVHAAAKSSQHVRAQLDAAYQTARSHARDLGFRGWAAAMVHRLLGWRTRMCYRWLKPR